MANIFYEARVEEVLSGDDLILMVDLGVEHLHKKIRARLDGVDTPDAHMAKANTEAGRIRDEIRKNTRGKCRIEITSRTAKCWIVRLHTHIEGRDVCLNDLLISRGYIYSKVAGNDNG